MGLAKNELSIILLCCMQMYYFSGLDTYFKARFLNNPDLIFACTIINMFFFVSESGSESTISIVVSSDCVTWCSTLQPGFSCAKWSRIWL